MPFILLLGLVFPRLIIVFLWFATDWFVRVSLDWIIALLGFIFLPYTLLWYSVVANMYGGVWGMWQILILAVAVLYDMYNLSVSARSYADLSY